MKFKVVEIRKNEKGEEFVVETIWEFESKKEAKKYLSEHPELIVDRNYRIKPLPEDFDIEAFERFEEP